VVTQVGEPRPLPRGVVLGKPVAQGLQGGVQAGLEDVVVKT
jgi:hypothetical protein